MYFVWSFGRDNFFVIFVKVKLIIRWIYIRYRMVDFKVRQTEPVIAIAQIYGREVASLEDATLIDERKCLCLNEY